MWRSLFLFFSLLLGLMSQLDAQSPEPSPTPTVSPTPSPSPPEQQKPPAPTAEPYRTEEFPPWLLALRRAEIIFFGSLPFSFLLACEGLEIGRYMANNFDPTYAPWPFRTTAGIPYTESDRLIIISSTLIISGLVALIDFIINQAQAPP